MAEATAKDRWPKLVQGLVDEMERSCSLREKKEEVEEGHAIAKKLAQLKSDIEQNRRLVPLEEADGDDIGLYNRQLHDFGTCTWRAAPWLFAECYMYRHIQAMFSTSLHWQGFDVFKEQKDSSFANSRAAVEELAGRYMQVHEAGIVEDEAKRRLLFEEMTHIALWGNATDLSLLTNLSFEDMGALQGASAMEKNRRNIIVNDIDRVYRHLTDLATSHRRIDIVLDNAGFEFFTDLIYASYLLHAGLASHIVLHTKSFPWFVSDVTPGDVSTCLDDLERSDIFPGRTSLDPVGRLLRSHFSKGEISVMDHPFWTTASPFQSLPTEAPDLYANLCQSDLVVFKGDLNYRKLTNDGRWPYTTPFTTALGSIGAHSGLRILALRTNKSDVCVGLLSEDQVKQLDEEAPNQAWVRNGKYAVVSYSDGQ
ncbi:damage-control phosphatase, subfamily III, partial [Tremellales sp. Uapishka_1]